MKNSRHHSPVSKGALYAAFLASAITAPAFAQGDEDSSDAAKDKTFVGLDEIIVTAQRKPESLQDAAIPINAVTGQDLARVGVADATALNKVAPALYVTPGGGANVGYFVRGVGNFANNGYTNPAVAFNIDGVYIGRPSSTIASFLDISAVEVLKGPQGTLYGRNATGGAINVIPTKPQLGENSGYVTAAYGNYDAYNLEGALNVAIGDESAARVAASYNAHDGYYSDGTGSAKDLAMRGQFYSAPSDSFNFRVSMDYSTQKGTGPGLVVDGVYGFLPSFLGGADLPVPNHPFIAAPANVSADYTGLSAPQTLAFIQGTAAGAPLFSPLTGYAYPFRNDRYFGTNAEVNFKLGGVEVVVIPAYRRSELDNQFNGPAFKAAINQDKADQYSVEARLSGTSGPLDWIVGGYYFDETVKGVNSFNQFSTVTHNSFDTNTKSKAGFVRATFNVTDNLRLVGGVRYTNEHRSIVADATETAGVCLTELPSGQPSCPQVPTLPVGLTLQDTINGLDPALFQPFRTPFDGNPIAGVYPFGPFQAVGGGNFAPGALLVVTPASIDRSAGDSQFTFRAAVEYDVTPENLVYASFENGFRAGGFNITVGHEEYDPEYIDAFTLGSKNRFFDNRFELNVELFYWKYRGQQLGALGLDARGNNAFYTRNVGKSTIKGVDIDFQFLATESTRLHGGVQYLDARYDSFVYNEVDLSDETAPPNFLTPVTGCTATQILTPSRSFDIDCSGKPALNSPKWTVNAGIEQQMTLGDLKLIGTLDGRYRGNRVIDFNYLPTGNSGSDFTMDVSLALGDMDDRWTLTAYVRNLTDKAVRSIYQLGPGNVASAAYEPPRTFGLRAKLNF